MRSKFIEEHKVPLEDQKFIGSDLDYRSIAFDKFEDEVHCELCGKKLEELRASNSRWCRGLQVHHKDMRRSNDPYYHIDNRPENLLVLCPGCHHKLHSKVHMTGREVSEETRRRMSEASKGNTSAKGSTRSEDARRKIRDAKKGKTLSEEHKRKLRESMKGNTNANGNTNRRGKTHSEESKRKMSEAKKGREGNIKGKKWYNDGVRSYRLDPSDERCKDLSEGMLKIKKEEIE